MTDIKHTVLIASYLEPELVEQIRSEVPQVEIVYRPDLLGKPRYIADHNTPVNRTPEQEDEWQALLAQADILFDFDHSHVKDLPQFTPKLKWIQATSAGIGQFVKQNYATTGWKFTTASGVHARPLAEFVILSMLFFARDFEYLQRSKAAHHWARNATTELAGKTLAIIGLGKIGQEAARLAKAFDMRVIGNRRSAKADGTMPNVDELYPPGDLSPLLTQADYLLLITPHTPETEGMIGAEQIDQLKKGAVVINISRGAVMDYKALTAALQNGHLRGAALDVFPVEPLPADDPLWDMPNVIVNPHSASTADTENAKITRIFIDNLKAYLADKPLHNLLDVERYY
ncbi:MAG: D-2-hydroxyacid dehydrogenase [Chloroflexi bacterium]|nr:D-2-hydroxyacid dehydrogenase [Chloroflexota bacterium]MCC6895283.1 D-2-hydroxyacid dehydrogenase [Anaerolineae bacterium]